jgi:hypothetical protein
MIRNSLLLGVVVAMGLTACGSDDIDSDEEARRAYFGLDQSIEKSITLGFAGFNSATSANISPQMATGIDAGTLVITGQVDQGSSDNKGMRLHVGMTGYNDGPLVIDGKTLDVDITYDTSMDTAMQPALDLQLKNIPNGTLTGTLTGVYTMRGDIEGDATLNLMFSGTIKNDGTGKVIRTPGTTTVTGTAVSGDGTYEVNLTL